MPNAGAGLHSPDAFRRGGSYRTDGLQARPRHTPQSVDDFLPDTHALAQTDDHISVPSILAIVGALVVADAQSCLIGNGEAAVSAREHPLGSIVVLGQRELSASVVVLDAVVGMNPVRAQTSHS